MPNGIAFSPNPLRWHLGWREAWDDQDASGRPVYIGRWLFLGPVALCWDVD